MSYKLHRVYMEDLLKINGDTITGVERAILVDVITLLEKQQHPISSPVFLPEPEPEPAPEWRHFYALPRDILADHIHRRLTMTETLIMALCSKQLYRLFAPLFHEMAAAYRKSRPTKADHKVATIGRTVSYRVPVQRRQRAPPPIREKQKEATTVASTTPQSLRRMTTMPDLGLSNETCYRCQRRGHITLDCPLGCRHCGRRGHTEKECGKK